MFKDSLLGTILLCIIINTKSYMNSCKIQIVTKQNEPPDICIRIYSMNFKYFSCKHNGTFPYEISWGNDEIFIGTVIQFYVSPCRLYFQYLTIINNERESILIYGILLLIPEKSIRVVSGFPGDHEINGLMEIKNKGEYIAFLGNIEYYQQAYNKANHQVNVHNKKKIVSLHVCKDDGKNYQHNQVKDICIKFEDEEGLIAKFLKILNRKSRGRSSLSNNGECKYDFHLREVQGKVVWEASFLANKELEIPMDYYFEAWPTFRHSHYRDSSKSYKICLIEVVEFRISKASQLEIIVLTDKIKMKHRQTYQGQKPFFAFDHIYLAFDEASRSMHNEIERKDSGRNRHKHDIKWTEDGTYETGQSVYAMTVVTITLFFGLVIGKIFGLNILHRFRLLV
ncbi:hypothetical protein SNEBB_007795 [Seison nebaliae]|nr:hypothetical protein SNEBB_007795 [Seison nebaliae]